MTETAIAQAMVFSVMYFFMDKPLPAIMLFVWAITERPPKEMIPVVKYILIVMGTDWAATIWTPVVISRSPERSP